MDNDEMIAKARKFIREAMKQPLVEDNEGMPIMAFCPTCYQTRTTRVSEKFALDLGENGVVMHQCETCRAQGKEIDLEKLKDVLSGERAPLPDINDNYTLSDLITDLLKKEGETAIKKIDFTAIGNIIGAPWVAFDCAKCNRDYDYAITFYPDNEVVFRMDGKYNTPLCPTCLNPVEARASKLSNLDQEIPGLAKIEELVKKRIKADVDTESTRIEGLTREEADALKELIQVYKNNPCSFDIGEDDTETEANEKLERKVVLNPDVLRNIEAKLKNSKFL